MSNDIVDKLREAAASTQPIFRVQLLSDAACEIERLEDQSYIYKTLYNRLTDDIELLQKENIELKSEVQRLNQLAKY